MEEELIEVLKRLSVYLSEHKAVSREELLMKIEEEVKPLEEKREELERFLEGKLEEVIFESITGEEKISVFSPDMHVKINYMGEVFYCPPSHRYMPDELEKAFLRLSKIRGFPGNIEGVVKEFLERCGYEVSEGEEGDIHKEMFAKKGENALRICLVSSIRFVPRFLGERDVIVVPVEKTPYPFITFVRENQVDDIREMIWVANPEKRTVDPLIGSAEDEEIEKHFFDPICARRAVSLWMMKGL